MVARLAIRRGSGGGGTGGSSDDDDDGSGGGGGGDRYQGYRQPHQRDQITSGGTGSGGSTDGQARAYTDDNSTSTVDNASVSAGDVTMDVEVRSGDGILEVETTLSGAIILGLRDFGNPDNTVDVTFDLEIPAQIKDKVEKQVRAMDLILGQYPSWLPQASHKIIPSDLRPINGFSLPLAVKAYKGGDVITGKSPVSHTIRFPEENQFGKFPVIVPRGAGIDTSKLSSDVPDPNFNINDLPPLRLRVTAKPKGGIKRLIGSAFGEVAETTIEIPASTFIEEMTIQDFSCIDLYPEIDAKLDEIPLNVDRKVELAKEQAQQLEELRDQVITSLSGVNSIDNVGVNVLRGREGYEAVQAIREAKNISPHRFQVASWKGSLTEAEEKLSNIALNQCSSKFTNRISDARERIASVEQYQSTINNLYHELTNIQLPDPTADLPGVPCADQYPEVAQQIQNLQDNLGSEGSGAKFELPPTPDDLETIKNRIQNKKDLIKANTNSGGRCRNQFMAHMTDLQNRVEGAGTRSPDIPVSECSNQFSEVENAVTDIENEAGIQNAGEPNTETVMESINPAEVDLSLEQFTNRINNRRATVRNNVATDSPCFDHYMNRLDTVQERVANVNWGGTGDESNGTDLSCSDVSQSVKNRVASVESAVGTWTDRRQIVREEDRKRSLLSELGEVESVVQNQISSENPCREKYLSRIQQAREQLLATGTRPKTAVPCEDRFPDIGTKVENFEDDVIALRPPVTPEQIQEFAQRGNELADQIEENIPADDPCRADMAERVRDLTNRVDKLTSQVRIEVSDNASDQAERDQMLEDLSQSLDEIALGSQ